MKKKFLVTAMAAVVLCGVVIITFLPGPVVAEERKPDENGHYILTIPKLFTHDQVREFEIWGTSCADLRGRDLGIKGKKMSHGYPGPEEKLFCFPPVDNIVDFIKFGEVEKGDTGFKNGPLLIRVRNGLSGDIELEKLKQEGKERALRFYGPLPPDAFWVMGRDADGYISVEGIMPCPESAAKADFCIIIDNYAHDIVQPKLDDLYGVYCWQDCESLKVSSQAIRDSVLFAMGRDEIILKEGYAQPLWRERQDYVDRIKQTAKGE